MRFKFLLTALLSFAIVSVMGNTKRVPIYFYGSENNDLYVLLSNEGYDVRLFGDVMKTLESAGRNSAVILVSDTYPVVSKDLQIDSAMMQLIHSKKLKVYIEYPYAFPGMIINHEPKETTLERAVITENAFGNELPPMSLLGIHNAYTLMIKDEKPLIVLAKVAGYDHAAYGLKNTITYPFLIKRNNILIATSKLSNFATGRYGPTKSWKRVWSYIVGQLTNERNISFDKWPAYVAPTYNPTDKIPADAYRTSVKNGVDWFYKGRFFIHPSWKQHWLNYQGDGTVPFGPPVDQSFPIGDGSLGILEGHASNIYYDGKQQYRYWMRADVQGEASMALAAAGSMLENKDYLDKARNLGNYVFNTSNMRAGAKNDSSSSAYGLIGWATTHPGSFYGDDNARVLLGFIGASAYLKTDQWNKELVEGILSNFRTTGKSGFRGERLEERDILKNGWKFYWEKDTKHISPHFESWMWACYLWLYNQTKYEPLLSKTKEAIRITMEAYPNGWLWGSSMQTQRARMILPLAWLLRIENTPEHRKWLDLITNDLISYQSPSGAIREEIGAGDGRFKPVKSNEDYGIDEASLIFKNGEPAADMLYTCNFAVFSLNEAVHATGDARYKAALNKLADFLVRIQVNSDKFNDIDGAWFRGFDYKRWDYWASNSDAGWGAWCTLTGWIQSWIVTTLVQIEQKDNFWDLTNKSEVEAHMKKTIERMFK